MVFAGLSLLAGAIGFHKYKSNNEKSAIATLKSLSLAQEIFFTADKDDDGEDYGTLEELKKYKMISGALAQETHHGYKFELQLCEDSSTGYWIIARPTKITVTGDHYFFVNHERKIFQSLRLPPKIDKETGARTGVWKATGY